MGTVSKPNTFTASTTIASAEVNANFDTIYDEFNGNIDNDNIDAAAAIARTKLANGSNILEENTGTTNIIVKGSANMGTSTDGNYYYVDITIGRTMGDTSYRVFLTSVIGTAGTNAFDLSVKSASRTTTTFRVISTRTGTFGFDWMIIGTK